MKVEPLPMPLRANSIIKQAKKPQKLPDWVSDGRNDNTPNTAAIMPINTHWVILAPLPVLSAIQPPNGRVSAPISGPRKAYLTGLTAGKAV